MFKQYIWDEEENDGKTLFDICQNNMVSLKSIYLNFTTNITSLIIYINKAYKIGSIISENKTYNIEFIICINKVSNIDFVLNTV